jgi:hypothetical protein
MWKILRKIALASGAATVNLRCNVIGKGVPRG